jgi:hypothetical protein
MIRIFSSRSFIATAIALGAAAQWGDFDRDGVVNRFDRAPRNPRRH